MATTDSIPLAKSAAGHDSFWPQGWWKIMEWRIGIIPVPVYILLVALIAGLLLNGGLPNEINVMIAAR